MTRSYMFAQAICLWLGLAVGIGLAGGPAQLVADLVATIPWPLWPALASVAGFGLWSTWLLTQGERATRRSCIWSAFLGLGVPVLVWVMVLAVFAALGADLS